MEGQEGWKGREDREATCFQHVLHLGAGERGVGEELRWCIKATASWGGSLHSPHTPLTYSNSQCPKSLQDCRIYEFSDPAARQFIRT